MKGKAIYNPSGKAGEYSYYAVNFYNGCSADCDYCYCKRGVLSSVWSTNPTLKKSLIDSYNALKIFTNEINKNLSGLREHGLFFNFTSDPFLKETIELNMQAIWICHQYKIPVKALTKQTWWIEKYPLPKNVTIGYTLTGMDEMEPGAATNQERIDALKYFHRKGYKTWASIEPIIEWVPARKMIQYTKGFVDHYKIGLLSGKKFDPVEINIHIRRITDFLFGFSTIYWKEGLIAQSTEYNPQRNCVSRNYKWWE